MEEMVWDRFAESKVDKMEKCRNFFNKLADILKNDYVVYGSCNKDLSAYLVPNGTEKKFTFYGKPVKSFRVSDHWNWFSSRKCCHDMSMVQCDNVDIPWRRRRDPNKPEAAVKPISGCQVGYFDADNFYHCVYGECFDRKTKMWSWVESSPEEVVERLGLLNERR